MSERGNAEDIGEENGARVVNSHPHAKKHTVTSKPSSPVARGRFGSPKRSPVVVEVGMNEIPEVD